LRFASEPRKSVRVAGYILRQKLKRDETMEASIFCLVHDTHAATPEFFEDAVMGDGLANHREGVPT
jgi:hypothetical protein